MDAQVLPSGTSVEQQTGTGSETFPTSSFSFSNLPENVDNLSFVEREPENASTLMMQVDELRIQYPKGLQNATTSLARSIKNLEVGQPSLMKEQN